MSKYNNNVVFRVFFSSGKIPYNNLICFILFSIVIPMDSKKVTKHDLQINNPLYSLPRGNQSINILNVPNYE